jgi:hypothetical protein
MLTVAARVSMGLTDSSPCGFLQTYSLWRHTMVKKIQNVSLKCSAFYVKWSER